MTAIRDRFLAFLQHDSYRPLTLPELMAALGVPRKEESAFRALLGELEEDGLIVRTRYERYGLPERMNLMVGTFQGHERGFGFVVPVQPGQEDLFIAPNAMGGAMHGDRVVARRGARVREGRQPEGEVIRVLRRANRRLVGTLERERGYGFVTPDERRIPGGVYIPQSALGKARSGEKVVVEVTRWPERRRSAEGRVAERLGQAGDPGVDILSVIHRFGLSLDFPPESAQQAAAVPAVVGAADLAGRRDLRHLLTVTIDGEDARDFDDAVSLERLGDGPARWRLGVHIADVSHYVAENSPLDREARERATSVYLVDRVVPMLPFELSHGICSLNPGVDRLTVSAFLDFDPEGVPVKHELWKSVIRSRARLTYNAVWRVIDADEPIPAAAPSVVLAATPAELDALAGVLGDMKALALRLRERRLRRGGIDFDLPEAKVVVDASGRPLEVRRAERNLAHQLIEEFMLAANETVAAHCARREAPFIYRIHEEPAEEKVESLADLLRALGVPFRPGKREPRDFQQVLEGIKGRPEEALVSTVMLRSMKQARYATRNEGHFGLAADHYCHFTSPIRRYPDLVVHRVLKDMIPRGGMPAQRAERLERDLPQVADHASQRERLAAEAEQETVKLKMAEYMTGRVGETFAAIISGVVPFGFFVQLDNLVEGLVHVSSMGDDYYQFDEKAFTLIGQRTGRRYRLGDRVTVRVARASAADRSVDFVVV